MHSFLVLSPFALRNVRTATVVNITVEVKELNQQRLICLKRHIVVHNDDNDGNSRNKRQRRSSSPQPGPSGLQSGSDGTRRRRSRTALNTFEFIKIFPSATVLKGFELFLNNSEKETIEHLEQKAREERGVRFYLNVKICFVRSITETGKKYLEEHFRSKCETCLLDE
ncbi:hypothetical protein AVEN_242004-1 [Araneus ventricosus]|uniref:Uncharacterized protein n=1 Tax=Araneus ventricosus TaxID=182803 RepID=A0A4Y2EBQ2_ARAVE|nr:hypothetical protein AVEN_242004-1 [Araneus ventricosus]